MDVQKVTSHPVHLVDPDGFINPTALVPFCSVSDNFSAMGVKINQIDVPVCNSFRPKLIGDQLCYAVDLNEIKNKIKFREKLFFTFFIDYNQDRELSPTEDTKKRYPINTNIAKNTIMIETIGKQFIFCKNYLM